ncbi:MAG: M20/M25/M40 family metallo-hydrolase [Candidatus Micrarchaeota archaeon]
MESLELLRKLVSINSVFPNERELAEYLEKKLRELGFTMKRIPISENRFNVVGERGTGGKAVMLYAHMDTVEPYGTWGTDPFTLTEQPGNEDKLIGLGSVDMKAGIAAILIACADEDVRNKNKRIKIAFGVDEENISEGAQEIAKSGFLNDVEFCISTESPHPDGIELGPKALTLGRRGRCVIEINVPGQSAHGANLSLGKNAISEAAKLIPKLEARNQQMKSHELLPPPTQFIRKIHGESNSLSTPDSVTLELDRHLVTPETPESALAETQKFIDSLYTNGEFREINGNRITARLKERKTPYLAPFVTEKNNPHVMKFAEIIKQKFGSGPKYGYGLSVADENIFAARGVPVAVIGAKGGNEHAANEWVFKSSYFELIDVLKTFLRSC